MINIIILGIGGGLLALALVSGSIVIVRQETVAIIERLGKFQKVARAGLNFKVPLIDRVAGRVSLRVKELEVTVESKAKDDVFVGLLVAVQYYTSDTATGEGDTYDRDGNVRRAFYRLSEPRKQIESYVFDQVRSEVPSMTFDEVFSNKEKIAKAVEEELTESMADYGYTIHRALVNDVVPPNEVRDAMNDVRAAERTLQAEKHRAEATKIDLVATAEAEKQSKILQGEGLAGQRKAIAKGLRESVETVSAGVGISEKAILDLLLLVQHYDTIATLADNSRTSTIFVPYSPGSVADLQQQITNGMIAAKDGAPELAGASTK